MTCSHCHRRLVIVGGYGACLCGQVYRVERHRQGVTVYQVAAFSWVGKRGEQ